VIRRNGGSFRGSLQKRKAESMRVQRRDREPILLEAEVATHVVVREVLYHRPR